MIELSALGLQNIHNSSDPEKAERAPLPWDREKEDSDSGYFDVESATSSIRPWRQERAEPAPPPSSVIKVSVITHSSEDKKQENVHLIACAACSALSAGLWIGCGLMKENEYVFCLPAAGTTLCALAVAFVAIKNGCSQ